MKTPVNVLIAFVEREQNKTLVRRFYEEVWNKGNYHVADELVADGGTRYDHETIGPNKETIPFQGQTECLL
jgi:hypothetical protein